MTRYKVGDIVEFSEDEIRAIGRLVYLDTEDNFWAVHVIRVLEESDEYTPHDCGGHVEARKGWWVEDINITHIVHQTTESITYKGETYD